VADNTENHSHFERTYQVSLREHPLGVCQGTCHKSV